MDNQTLCVDEMIDFFDTYKGRSKTSCPAPGDWLEAFGDADDIFCVTITSGLSGSYNAACIAKQMYEEENPGRRVHVIDSLSTGPEMQLMIEKLQDCIQKGMPFEEICEAIAAYAQTTGLMFILQSLKNFAANGRVSPAVAKLTGILGICIVGKASSVGTLEPISKPRGEMRALQALVAQLKEQGLSNGKVHIAHCQNEAAANRLQVMLKEEFPGASVSITTCRGLCSYYAEKGGLLIGYEKQ